MLVSNTPFLSKTSENLLPHNECIKLIKKKSFSEDIMVFVEIFQAMIPSDFYLSTLIVLRIINFVDLDQDLENFQFNGQIVNIFSFADNTIFVAATQLSS